MELFQLSDQQIIEMASPIMDNLMEGSTEKDWKKHTRDFSEQGKKFLTEVELLRQCDVYQESHGHFTARKLVGITRHPEYINVLWAQEMSKVSGEYMAILTLVQRKKKILVARCWVDLWDYKP